MRKLYFVLPVMVCSFLFLNRISFSQVYYGKNAEKYIPSAQQVHIGTKGSVPDYIEFKPGEEVNLSDLHNWMINTLKTTADMTFSLIRTEHDNLGFIHYRYQQLYKNIPIRDGIFIVHTRNGKIQSLNGRIINKLLLGNTIILNEDNALHTALKYVGATRYKWEIPSEENLLRKTTDNPTASYYPKGEYCLVPSEYKTPDTYKITFKFNIYADTPLSRQDIYVDAATGKIVLALNLIHNADVKGTAVTKYSGTREITTDSYNGSYRLRETGRGNGIETYNMKQGTSYANAVDFTDTDNYWDTVNTEKDEVATDAQWASEKTYDYYDSVHGRNSIDGNGFKLINYVHYNVDYLNAFWNGQYMTFGDGSGSVDPLCPIDIVGHEITHGLTSFSADLDYSYESGALSEGFSDIFGASIEFFAKPEDANWTVGEDINLAIRSLSNPKDFNLPDTYKGEYWATGSGDNGGVHRNCGALCYWFYLCSDGGSGTNDNNDNYNVTAIGIEKAGAIAFRMLTVYLINTSQYADARFYAILSAADLYGDCSQEMITVTDAMYAIGVGSAYSPGVTSEFSADFTKFCKAPATIKFLNSSTNSSIFTWHFGDGLTSQDVNPVHTYTSLGNFDVKLISDGGACGKDSISKSAFISIISSNPCITIMPETGSVSDTSCSGTLYDNGGLSNYINDVTSTVVISPPDAIKLNLEFKSFAYETDFDYLDIYDGPNTSATLIGTYTGTSLPNGGTVETTGGSVTIVQRTDQASTDSGFEMTWHCEYGTIAPTCNFICNTATSCTGKIQFTDKSSNGPKNWKWHFGDGGSSTIQHPVYTYSANGVYTVKLVISNDYGTDSLTKTSLVTIQLPDPPLANNTESCKDSSAVLSGTGTGTLRWFDSQINGNLLGTGSPFKTPPVTTNTTFYVEDYIETPVQKVGPVDNTIGTGKNFTINADHGLLFDVLAPVIIKSVKVYSGISGERRIEVLSGVGGTVIASKTIQIPSGESRVTLDFQLAAANKYFMKVSGSLINLYRNDEGASFPYTINGLITITETDVAPSNPNFYYYFYDWEVQTPPSPCISSRIPVKVTLLPEAVSEFTYSNNDPLISFTSGAQNGISYLWDFGDGQTSAIENPSHTFTANGTYTVYFIVFNNCGSDTSSTIINIVNSGIENIPVQQVTIFPNPAKDKINISLLSLSNQNITIRLTDIVGQTVLNVEKYISCGKQTIFIDGKKLSKGIYTLSIKTGNGSLNRRIIIE